MQIDIKVTNQKIERLNSPGSVGNTLNYLTCHFTFDGEEWDNTVKTAYFRNPASGKIYPQILADDGTCIVPWEALTDTGTVRFSVAGERENYRITTDVESFYNSETVYGGEPSEPPTPDQYDQLIALAEQTKEIAESVREDADAGKFDGEPGKPGDPGKDGVSPAAKVEETNDGAVITVTDATGTTKAKLKNGKDGNPGQDATDEQVQAAVDAYMEEHPIQGDAEDIIKLAIKNEASGAVPITITDSADMGVQDLEMQGWTEQAQYEGKNLFDILDFESNNKGIIENETILFNQNLGTVRYYLKNLSPGTYSISIKRSGFSGIDIGINEVLVINNGGSANYTGNFDVSDGDSVVLNFSEGQNPNGEDRMVYDIMLNSGSTALPYEPYTGGAPSPSPDYPQEITSAGKYDEETGKWEYRIEVATAQLFNSDGEYVTGTYRGYPINNAGQAVTITLYEKDASVDISDVYFGVSGNGMDTSDGYNWMISGGVVNKTKLQTTSGYITVFPGDNITKILDRYEVMVNFGNVSLPYQKYVRQTVTITSERPLTKWDRLENRDGVWGWVYKSGSHVVTGEEDFTAATSEYKGEETSCSWFANNEMISKASSNTQIGYCERLSWSSAIWSNGNDGKIGFTFNNNQIHMRLRNADTGITGDDNLTTIPKKIEAYVAQKYQEGNPFIFWYETAEKTFVPLSESEQESLNALHTYYPTTMLSNDAGCDMSLTYIADTKAYIDSKIAAIQAAVVNRI